MPLGPFEVPEWFYLNYTYGDWSSFDQVEYRPLWLSPVPHFKVLQHNLESLVVPEKPVKDGVPGTIPQAFIGGILWDILKLALKFNIPR